MSNNAHDYENDLVFPPEMTWEELVEKAKELGYEYDDELEKLTNQYFYFYKTGGEIYGVSFDLFTRHRTPAQMYQIMLALEN